MNPTIVKRLREFFELSSMVDADTGILIDDNDPKWSGPKITKSQAVEGELGSPSTWSG